ncbi:MAG: ABC transporter permease subunit [Microbacterium sp.]
MTDTRSPVRERGPRSLTGMLDNRTTYFLLALAVFLIVWEAAARAMDLLLLPTVGETVVGLFHVLTDPEVWVAFGRSNLALLVGYVAAVVIGIPVGILIGRSEPADRAAAPYIAILIVTPMAGIIPLVIMALGLTLAAASALVFVFAVPMVIVNTRAGARGVDVGQIEMARSHLASRAALFRFVYLPGSLIGIMSGLRLALGRAVAGMVLGELLLVATGIGGLILHYQSKYQSGELYAVVLLVLVEAWLLAAGVSRLERATTWWALTADKEKSR